MYIYTMLFVWVPKEAKSLSNFLELELPADGCELPDMDAGPPQEYCMILPLSHLSSLKAISFLKFYFLVFTS